MTREPKPRTRTAVKQGRILRELRQEIMRGRYGFGRRLPTRLELQERFDVSLQTVQRAMEHLSSDGFIQARGNAGTFVCDTLPHLSHYALVFPSPTAGASLFYGALVQAAARVPQALPGLRLSQFFGVDEHRDSADYQRLRADAENHRLAGVIFATPPFGVDAALRLGPGGPPCVAVMGWPAATTIPAIGMDFDAFYRCAVDDLTRRGRKRPGLVAACNVGEQNSRYYEELFIRSFQKRGIRVRPEWVQYVNSASAWTVERAVQTLLLLPPADRPDALVIADDNLVEPATRALAATPAGAAIDVVAHCNFPTPPRTLVPVRFIGFDACELLALCLRLLDAQRRGQRVPPMTVLPPRREAEVAAASPFQSLRNRVAERAM